MATFKAGDRVCVIGNGPVPKGTLGTVLCLEWNGATNRCLFDNGTETQYASDRLAHHVDSFPIAAANDPWRNTEPGDLDDEDPNRCPAYDGPDTSCDYQCSRVAAHNGHHVARNGEGQILARWPQSAPAEKRGPRVGDEVVFAKSYCERSGAVLAGVPGRIVAVTWFQFDVEVVLFGGDRDTYHLAPESFGDVIILAAEWDAQQKRDTIPAPRPSEPGKSVPPLPPLNYGPPPAGNLDFLAPHNLERDIFAAKLAIAMFEDDNASAIARVADDDRGGIGTAAVRERLVWGSAECQREQYMAEAKALLKRAGELP